MSNLLKIDADRLNIEDIIEKIQTGMGGFNPTVGLPLFSYIWCDHFLDDDNFVRSDDFSWHNGLKYKKAYQHLVDDIGNVQMTTWYAFATDNATSVLYTTEEQGEIDIDVVVYDSPGVINEYYTNDVGMIWRDGYILSGKDRYFYRDSTRDIKISQHETETETIGDITISFHRAEDGHKICLSDQEYKIRELYEKCGVAWYYILDTENKKFKLPHTKYGFTGLRDDVGNYVDESLPNITGKMGGTVCLGGSEEGALYKLPGAATGVYGDKTATSTYSSVYGFDASRSSSTYQDGAAVQQRATQMYLYFFLGNGSSETEYEMNILKGGLELGDIGIAPFGIDESQNKRRYLNGQLINQTQFKEFTSLIKGRISLYPSIATTEENWQAEVTNSALGQCGKFVVDDTEGTIRLPKVVNMQGLADLSKLAEIVEAGLPNITGGFTTRPNNNPNGTGAFSSTWTQESTGVDASSSGYNPQGGGTTTLDASRSNSIYGNSDTVQQEAIQYPYFIQVSVGSSLINGTPYINDVEDLKSTSLRTSTITNCITEIPQDIKLELNNGTLTLKAGSKVYVPNGKNADGSNKFDEVVTTQDLSATAQSLGLTDGGGLLYCMPNSSSIWVEVLNESGTTNPSLPWTTYYNTSENKVYRFASSNTTSAHQGSFSIAKVSFSNSTLTSIDQVFNGFGYIGSTVFALPGVKGLIPNGRNADGSLRNIEYTQNVVAVYTASSGASGAYNMNSQMNGAIYPLDCYYNNNDNIIKLPNGELGTYQYIFGTITFQSGRITSFQPKTTFHALDYNDKATVVGWGMPDYSAGIDITTGYTAPTDGFVVLLSSGGGNDASSKMYVNNVLVSMTTIRAPYNQETSASAFVKKGDVIKIEYIKFTSFTFYPLMGV